MPESINVDLMSWEELEKKGLLVAAVKAMTNDMKDLKKAVKVFMREGESVPKELRERIDHLENHRLETRAKITAKAATEQAIAGVKQQFADFQNNLNTISGIFHSGGMTPMDAARMAGGVMVNHLLNTHAERVAGISSRAAEHARKNGASATDAMKAGSDAIAAAEQGSTLMGAMGAMSGAAKWAGSAAGSSVLMAARVGWEIGSQVSGNIISNQKQAVETNQRANERAKRFQVMAANLANSEMWSSNQMAEYQKTIASAGGRIEIDQLSVSEQTSRLADVPFMQSVKTGRVSEWAAANILNYMWGDFGEGKRKRAEAAMESEEKMYWEAQKYGSKWGDKWSAGAVIDRMQNDENSREHQDWATKHTEAGGQSVWYKLAYLIPAVGPFVSSAMKAIAMKYDRQGMEALAEEERAKEVKRLDDFFESEKVMNERNPAFKAVERDRAIWLNEAGRQRYFSTKNWNPI